MGGGKYEVNQWRIRLCRVLPAVLILIVIGGACLWSNFKHKAQHAAKREEEQKQQSELRKQEEEAKQEELAKKQRQEDEVTIEEKQGRQAEKEDNTEKESQRDIFLTETEREMRGIWVASVGNMDYPVSPTLSSSELRDRADRILDHVEAWGFNTIFLQVRPCSDAFYKSEFYPWSVYLTGRQGVSPDNDFDPLDYWVTESHKRNIELHAWINPFRITHIPSEWDRLAEESPARQHPDWTVAYEGNYYFDPALPEVRRFIIDGAVEIAENYEVDGIHMDDYFYPGTDFDDASSYAVYGGDFADIGDWRRNNVNLLIQGLEESLHKADPDIEFGISPAGIWASNTLNSEGSATTSTYSSYYSMYADSKYWVKAGWLDYIAPQIYWEIGHETADFTALLDWWSNVISLSGNETKLYIGLADYKTLEAAGGTPWDDGAEINRQINVCNENAEVSGVIHFRYGSIAESPHLQQVLRRFYTEDVLH